ncbi:hypothetical protein BH20ACT24_BH20ACT24_17470 [soil metagenome]
MDLELCEVRSDALHGIGWSEEFASLLVESQIAIDENRIVAGERTAENATPTSVAGWRRT